MAQILLNLSDEKKSAVKQMAVTQGLSVTKFILKVLDDVLELPVVIPAPPSRKITQEEINTYFRYARQIQNTLYCGSPRFAKMMGFDNIYEFNETPVTVDLMEKMKDLHRKYCRNQPDIQVQPGDFPEYHNDFEIDQERHALVDQHQSRALNFVAVLEQTGLTAFEFQERYDLTPAEFNDYVMGKKEWNKNTGKFRRIIKESGKTHTEVCDLLPVSMEKLQAALAGAIVLTDEQLKVIWGKLPAASPEVF